jgi:hypothetical protein
MGLVSSDLDEWTVASRFATQPASPQALPRTLLSDSFEDGDNVARMLESLGLAYVEVGVLNNLGPLGGFVNLLDLGRAGNGLGSGLNSYGSAADFLDQWVRTGSFATAVPATHRVLSSISGINVDGVHEGSTPEERREALVNEFVACKSFYAERYRQYLIALDESVNVLSAPPLWVSMYSMIDTSLDQLINAVNRIDLGTVRQDNASTTSIGRKKF